MNIVSLKSADNNAIHLFSLHDDYMMDFLGDDKCFYTRYSEKENLENICHSVSSQAYMYTMSMLSYQTHTEESVKKYLYTMTRIYIICVLNTSNEVKKYVHIII